MRRAVAVEITGDLLKHMFTEGWKAALRCTAGLPEGARFAGSYARQWEGSYVRNTPTVVLIFEHPDFAEVPDGGVIPRIEIEWQQFGPAEWPPRA